MQFIVSHSFDPVDLVEKQFRQFQTFRLLGVKFNSNNLLQNNGIPIFCKVNQQRGKQLLRNSNTINFMNTCTQLEIQIRQWFLECISEQISTYFPVSKLMVQEQILIPYQIRNQYQKSSIIEFHNSVRNYQLLQIIQAEHDLLNLICTNFQQPLLAILIQFTIQSSFSRQLLSK
ncbi:Hypothetical_protein [Hexamita inflata]|uniref:Hypothetical_protein n=1 Tax=Hexamita inflata TaxID=28002 RepID=A0AA86TK95_9EUKA|nr:Hypothetical protein HINF_LOCUS7560 [Hexamita inflata]